MTRERANRIKKSVFNDYYVWIDRMSGGFDNFEHALNFGRILGRMEGELIKELDKEVQKQKTEDDE